MERPGAVALPGEFIREGEYWKVAFGEREFRVHHSKGIGYLAELLSKPGVEIEAPALAGGLPAGQRPSVPPGLDGVEGDLGPVLDAQAKAAYRRRLAELEAERDEAEGFHDHERAARARVECEALAAELALAVGLGGRDRRVGDPVERARVNVTRAIKTAIRTLREHDPAVGQHFAGSVRTGRWCVYRPKPADSVAWRVLTRPAATAATAADREWRPPVTRYVDSGRVSIAYQALGEGDLDIVAVPGLISHLDLWWENAIGAAFWRRLASLGRLIMFDKRDTGLSDSSPEKDSSLERRMDDMLAVMDACQSSRAVLYGYSEGGAMSILFAATYPERVSALILAAAHARTLPAPDYPCSSEPAVHAIEQLAAHAWGQGDSIEWYAPSLTRHPQARQNMARWERMAASPSSLLRLLHTIREIDVRAALPTIQVPTLVIQRLDDRVVPPCHGRYLAEHIPGAHYFDQPGDHMLWAGDSEPLLAEIEQFLTGAHRPPEPDRVLTTILLTDIVDSTAAASKLGDARWRTVLNAHNANARREVDSHRGQLIKNTGDGILATFDGPGRAIRCASALRNGAAQLGIDIRSGVHTGEIELLDNDIAGIAVHIASRTNRLAPAGQILVTRTVKDLVAGSNLHFADHGEHDLKGVPERWQLFSVQS